MKSAATVEAEKHVSTSSIRHVRGYSPDRFLCGAERDPSLPTRWGYPDCVVCIGLAPPGSPEHDRIADFWESHG